ncbi:hypothetical protein GCM10010269_39380 [Streptomyces humidus]|uniref:Uncharacterized protein n=1 Tax=Streptomyces humidus TaxID=52259 RepID=A0A918FWR2_9ACTN|nr:hypothetical protein GCM10010269_39380 [Streptomyces humidus]
MHRRRELLGDESLFERRVRGEVVGQGQQGGGVQAEILEGLTAAEGRLGHRQTPGDEGPYQRGLARDGVPGPFLVRAEKGEQGCRPLPQGLVVLGGQHEQPGAARCGPGGGLRRLLQHQMGVGAARAEGAEPGQTPAGGRARPGRGAALHRQPAVPEVEVRVERVGVQRGRQGGVPELQEHLGEPGDAGRALQMTDVGLHRADGHMLGTGCEGGQRRAQALQFDRVAERGAGAVGLDVAEGAHVGAGLADRVGDERGLRGRAGHGEPAGTAAVVEPGGADDGVDVVAVGERPVQRLEEYRPDALAGHVAGAALAEGAAPAVL